MPNIDSDEIIFRVAIAAFTYYDTKEADDPTYLVDDDVEWCIEPLRDEGYETEADMLASEIRELIVNVHADRRGFIDRLRDAFPPRVDALS
jgi:hypothetical protein